ncbi:methylcrotonoyl-CoA carboxylase 1 [Brevipalpus obovatus]|uniref:methylcrotonoyl-CoA carboxylase 1 n=1 Tax=Brevipalpus obovatus TaxID=246614 RepID=UPI003D9EC345
MNTSVKLSSLQAWKIASNGIIRRVLAYSTQARVYERSPRYDISKILIANRGEIGCRVVRTARKMGLTTTAVYSNFDRDSMLVHLADEAINLGPSPTADSYMNKEKIIAAAKRCGAQAIHPGYGFLSENPEFADLCDSNGLIFIGPPASAIKNMGIKSIAKQIMADAGVPVILGYHGDNQDDAHLLAEAEKIGFPIMIKAIKGGGGKGMRISNSKENFLESLQSARRESLKSFGDDSVLIEKYVSNPRHVEVQVFADKLGNCVYLFERDCSVQRRHQKIIEEAPGPDIDESTRVQLGEAAVRAAKAVNYVGAGTVEFIYDRNDGNFYFMEMNTRIQVEHPVTEMITGQDLVEWQIRIARGEPLPLTQKQIRLSGHSFEARIYAEDPDNNFMPGAGKVDKMFLPMSEENVRVETGLRAEGDQVLVHYDPMIAKLVVWGSDRTQALIKLRSMLSKFNVIGLKTNVDFLLRLTKHPEFVSANVHTDFVKEFQETLLPPTRPPPKSIVATAAMGIMMRDSLDQRRQKVSPHLHLDGFRLHGTMPSNRKYTLQSGDQKYAVQLSQIGRNQFSVVINNEPVGVYETEFDIDDDVIRVSQDGITKNLRHMMADNQVVVFTNEEGSFEFDLEVKNTFKDSIFDLVSGASGQEGGDLSLKAPIPGVVEKILVSEGETVEPGTPVMIMMAMKMEYIIKSNQHAIVDKIFHSIGENVQKGAQLVKLKNAAEKEKVQN